MNEDPRYERLHDIKSLGYSIDVTERDGSKFVTLNGRYALEPYTLPRCYSTEYTDVEVQFDCMNDLMTWAGLHYERTLTHKIRKQHE